MIATDSSNDDDDVLLLLHYHNERRRLQPARIAVELQGKFDELKELCEVVYLPRTPSISSTAIKRIIAELEAVEVEVE